MAAELPAFKELKALGRMVTERREQCGMTRQELADRVGCPYHLLARIEAGSSPGTRHFWVLADRALAADGTLLADADQALLIWAAAMREGLRRRYQAGKQAGPDAGAVDRTFADRLGMIVVQARRHPEVLAAVERYRPRMGCELAALTDAVRVLLYRTDFPEDQIFADVWQTLLHQDPRQAALLSAAAIVELARIRTRP